MHIRDWLKEVELRVPDLARLIDAKQPTVYTWVNGVKLKDQDKRHYPIPPFVYIKAIKKLTKGKVGYNDWGV